MYIWFNKELYCLNREYTIFQFCSIINENLPCLCYHEKLTIAGNCRICLVEVESSMNLVASCAMPIMDNMVITIDSKRAVEAREAVLEFLLLNHPLDCPVCDQAGECDLQDLTFVMGTDYGRYDGSVKRAVDNLNCFGPLVKTVMTRCIHCTRCVRFTQEISGSYDFGVIGRGWLMEINAINDYLSDELVGNVIDLCPVGALTSMPYAYTKRYWELQHVSTIDILDAIASSIRVDIANKSVARIVPNLDESVNGEWITNKARFAYDSLNAQRAHYPYVRIGSLYVQFSWNKIFDVLTTLSDVTARDRFIEVYCGPFTSLETALSVKTYFHSMGCYNIFYSRGDIFDLCDLRYYYLLNDTLVSLEYKFNVLFLGIDCRLEVPVLNARFRKNFLNNVEFNSYSIGLSINHSTYPIVNLGNTIKTLSKFLEGKLSYIRNIVLTDFLTPSFFNYNYLNLDIFVGSSYINRIDGHDLLYSLYHMVSFNKLDVSNINVISSYLGRISMSEIGLGCLISSNDFYINNVGIKKLIYLCGADTEYLLDGHFINKSSFVVYLGPYSPVYHSDRINIIMPTSIYSEESAHYLNLEGRLRKSTVVLPSESSNRSVANILNALYFLRKEWVLDNYSKYQKFDQSVLTTKIKYNSHYDETLSLILYSSKKSSPSVLNIDLNVLFKSKKIFISDTFDINIYNYYATDGLVNNSPVMACCSSMLKYVNFVSIDTSNIKI